MEFRYKLYLFMIMFFVVHGAYARKKQVSQTQPIDVMREKEDLHEIESEAATLYSVDQQQFLAEQQTHHIHAVRVLLDEFSDTVDAELYFDSSESFELADNPSFRHKATSSTHQLVVKMHGEKMYVHGRAVHKNQLYIRAKKSACISYKNRQYEGVFILMLHKSTWLLINVLDLESYVCAVLKTESWPGWPLEVNKAFAITSRTYALAMILRADAMKMPYHLRNTNAHQTYQGVHHVSTYKKAVEKTKGVFLAYDNKPILAMFDSCCGGVIPALIKDFDFSKAPYLARSYPCTYCKKYSIFSWHAEYEKHDFLRTLRKEFSQLSGIKMIRVQTYDDAGLAETIAVIAKKHKEVFPAKKLYSLYHNIKSYCFSITLRDDRIIIDGRGFGHHIGLCQWGAREMIRHGHNYRSILQFYYPGATFKSLIM